MDERQQKILDKVKILRKDRSIADACKQAGVTVGTYYAWLRKSPKKRVARKIKILTNVVDTQAIAKRPSDDMARFMGIMLRNFFQGGET